MATQTAVLKIDLQIEGGQKLALSVGNLKELKDAIKQINDTRITLDPRSPQFQAASNQLKTLQGLYKGLSKDADSAGIQIDQAAKSLNEQPKAIGYYRQLQAQLVTLKNQFKDLSETEARGKLGQGLASNINTLSGKLKGLDANLGDFQRNVGNYRGSLISLGDVLTGGLITGGVVAGVATVSKIFEVGISQAVKYEKALDDLSALTGVSGAQLEGFKDVEKALRNIKIGAEEVVSTGPEILNSLRLVGGARPELLEDAKALGEVSKSAIVLSKASGEDLDTSVRAITSSLAQFGLEASDSSEIINLFAAGSKEGKVEIGGLADSLTRLGPSAKNSNVSLAESIAVFENLANSGLEGERAAIQLRNVLITLSSANALPKAAQEQFKRFGVDVDILSNKNLTLGERLKELEKIGGDVTAMFKIFGKENIDAALILAQTAPDYERLLKSIQGTNEAFAQAEIRAGNATTAYQNLKNTALNSLQEEFEGTTTSGAGLLNFLTSLTEGFTLFGEKISAVTVLSDISVGPLSAVISKIRGFFAPTESKNGLLGLDLDELKKTIDLTTGELIPAIDDTAKARKDGLAASLEAAAALNDETDNNTASTEKNSTAKSKAKVENLGAADSIARLTKNVQLYRDELDKAPQDKLFDATVKLVKAEQLLAAAEARRRIARENATSLGSPATSEIDQANAGLLTLPVVVDTPANEAEAKRQLDALALSLSGSVGVVMPVDIDQDQARKDFEIQKYFLDQEDKIRQLNDEKEKERKEKRESQNQEFLAVGLQAADQFNQQLAASDNARVERQLSASLTAIDEEFATKREAAQGNAIILANLDKQQKAKVAAAEKDAAKQRKAIAIKEATIAFFLALIRAAPNPAALALAAATYAISLVGIQGQEFHAGGKVKNLKNESGVVTGANMRPTVRGDNKVALLRVGERVLTEQNQRDAEMQYGTGVWKSIRAKDPGSILGQRQGSMAPPIYAAGGNVLKVTTNLSRDDIGRLSSAISQTNDRMAGVVEGAMIKGAKYAAREAKVFSKTG